MHQTVLISTESNRDAEAKLLKIARFAGMDLQCVSLLDVRKEPSLHDCNALIASAEAFQELFRNCIGAAQTAGDLRLPANLFVFGFSDKESGNDTLKLLKAPVCTMPSVSLKGAQIDISRELPALSRELSGVSFECKRDTMQSVFSNFSPGAYRPLFSISGMPAAIVGNVCRSAVMLVAGREFIDLDSVAEHEARSVDMLPQFMPFLAFLRQACPGEVWESSQTSGCFIVDDPPLKSRYGSLNLDAILQYGRNRKFAFSIAFIPWNFRRSERAIVEQFKTQGGQFSICVHGCDHTWGEFESHDEAVLHEKAKQAMSRMEAHRRMTGLEFDDVFVPPQGLFSKAALKILNRSGYLAAINSTVYPTDYARDLTIRDLLDVAVTRFSDFPLFTRKYPHELAELAFDVFLGRPALMVEHHEFFKARKDEFARVVDDIEKIVPHIRWTRPAAACQDACLRKIAENGDVMVRFFTPRFAITNESEHAKNYILIKELRASDEIKSVFVNGKSCRVPAKGQDLRLELLLKPGENAVVKIECDVSGTGFKPRFQPVHAAKVLFRRTLAELRANYSRRDTREWLRGHSGRSAPATKCQMN